MTEPNFDDAFDDDLKTSNFNRAIEHHFEQVLNEESFLESVMMEYFSEEYSNVASLPEFHKFMLWAYNHSVDCKYKDKWIEGAEWEAKRRADG
jgi:hypothetical protein